MIVKIKKGVSIVGIKPELAFLWPIVLECVREQDPKAEVQVTSIIRKRNKSFTLHGPGFAIDFTVKWSGLIYDTSLKMAINRQIGHHVDSIFHDAGTGKHHHLEVDEH